MAERDMKRALFGEVAKPKGGPFIPTQEQLRRPFERSDSVARGFCRNCGLGWEFNDRQARHQANLAFTHFDGAIPQDIYFEIYVLARSALGTCRTGSARSKTFHL